MAVVLMVLHVMLNCTTDESASSAQQSRQPHADTLKTLYSREAAYSVGA